MNHTKPYTLIKVQALRFHEVCTRFSLYTKPIDETVFLSLIDGFLVKMTQGAEPKVLGQPGMGALLETVTESLERFMHPYLPATEEAIQHALQRVAKEFYQSLVQARLLTPTALRLNELLEKRQRYLEITAQAIVEGHESLVIHCISLPSSILGELHGIVPQMYWDSEWGGEALLECIEQFFDQLPFEFAWKFDKEADRVACRVDTHQWEIENVSFKEYEGMWDDIKIYKENFRQLNEYFVRHELVLIDVPTWGQAALWLLVPLENLDDLNIFLGSHESSLYIVVPHIAVPNHF